MVKNCTAQNLRAILLSIVALGALAQTVLGQTSLPDASAVDEAMRRANNYWMASNSVGNAGWARGAYNTGNHRAFRVLGERAYHNWEVTWGNANQWKIGPEGAGSADAYTCGQTYIDLYRMDLQPLYLANIKSNIDALVASPAVNGWSWIDAFYMQAPVLARVGNLTGDTNYFNKLWLMYDDMKTRRGLFDASASLWYRDGNYTNALDVNGQKIFWSRGNGWVFAGLARVLQQMPTNAPHYQDYVTMFQTMAPAIKVIQGTDGMWRSSLYDTNQFPNPETSGTGLFTYGLTWGVRNGLLPVADYTNTIGRAWQGLTNLALQASGRVGWVQNVGAAPAGTTTNTTTDFGVGAFLLACSEVYLMAPDAPAIRPWAGPDQTVIVTNGNPVTISLDASLTEIYKGSAVSYSWWEGVNYIASGTTASTTLSLGSHVITLKVQGSDDVIYTDSMTVNVTKPPLSGSIIGSPGSWSNLGNTITNAFDGDLTTFYDAVNASGDWAGLDLGAPKVITQVRYCPRGGFASRMVNGVFQAANNSNFTGAVTLFTITNTPPEGMLTSQPITNATAFRYVRYLGPNGGNCNVAEVEFYGRDPLSAFETWQLQYFGCTDCSQSAPDADPLGKGISNTNQFLLGLNPTNSSSLFRIVSIVTQGSNVKVTWQTAGAHTNVLQASSNASGDYSNNFVDILSSMTAISGSGDAVTNYTDAGGATNGVSRFYRVRLVP